MQITDWLRRKKKTTDGYDPDAKDEQGGKERNARQQIRKSIFADPFSDATRRTRRTLLALSVLALLINAGMQFGLKRILSDQASTNEIAALLSVMSIGIVYFLATFIVSAGHEYSRWRLSGHVDTLQAAWGWTKGINDLYWQILQLLKNIDSDKYGDMDKTNLVEANEKLPDINRRIERTWNYYVSNSRLQMIRILVLDFALPLGVSLLALWKVAPLVWPMIVQIATA